MGVFRFNLLYAVMTFRMWPPYDFIKGWIKDLIMNVPLRITSIGLEDPF